MDISKFSILFAAITESSSMAQNQTSESQTSAIISNESTTKIVEIGTNETETSTITITNETSIGAIEENETKEENVDDSNSASEKPLESSTKESLVSTTSVTSSNYSSVSPTETSTSMATASEISNGTEIALQTQSNSELLNHRVFNFKDELKQSSETPVAFSFHYQFWSDEDLIAENYLEFEGSC